MLIARALGRSDVGITDLETAPVAPGAWPGRRVAVVLVDGNIVDGPSQELPFGIGGVAGSDSLLSALEECRADSTVGAVVLRVNSPGGSAFASDVIARADPPAARGGQAGHRVDGRHGRVGRLLHRGARRRHLRRSRRRSPDRSGSSRSR